MLLAVLGCVAAAVGCAAAALHLAASWPALRAVPGAGFPVAVAGVVLGGVGLPVTVGAAILAARSRRGRRPRGDLGLMVLAAAMSVAGGVLLAAAVVVLLWLLSSLLPDTALEVLAVVLTIAPLPFVGPVTFRVLTGRAPGERSGGLLPPLPRRLREPRRRPAGDRR